MIHFWWCKKTIAVVSALNELEEMTVCGSAMFHLMISAVEVVLCIVFTIEKTMNTVLFISRPEIVSIRMFHVNRRDVISLSDGYSRIYVKEVVMFLKGMGILSQTHTWRFILIKNTSDKKSTDLLN